MERYGISLHLFMSSLIYPISLLWLFAYRSCAWLLDLDVSISVFGVILNGSLKNSSYSNCSLLMYKNETEIYILTVYPGAYLIIFEFQKTDVYSLGFVSC